MVRQTMSSNNVTYWLGIHTINLRSQYRPLGYPKVQIFAFRDSVTNDNTLYTTRQIRFEPIKCLSLSLHVNTYNAEFVYFIGHNTVSALILNLDLQNVMYWCIMYSNMLCALSVVMVGVMRS